MIIEIGVKNWLSFKDEIVFSMVASKEQHHRERLANLKKYNLNILPISAIYGPNASGKSNFIQALRFVKKLIVQGTSRDESIGVKPFLLNKDALKLPTEIRMVIFTHEKLYEFSFAATSEEIYSERLTEMSARKKVDLYIRSKSQIVFPPKTNDFLNYVAKGTRKNQLFLTNSIDQNVADFKDIYDWFKENLEILSPKSEAIYNWLDESAESKTSGINRIIPLLDTGINRITGEKIPVDSLPFPKSVVQDVVDKVRKTKTDNHDIGYIRGPGKFNKYSFVEKDGNIEVGRPVSYHSGEGGIDVRFDMNQESDGTLRAIDLLPAFLDSSRRVSSKVYFIDELDRSLHHLLTRSLIEQYLSSCNSNTRSQLIFTTHDLLLMNQKIFRRDEMHIVEKDRYGASEMFSLDEYKNIRYDLDISKNYLQGRLGGIPHILLNCPVDTPTKKKSKK